MGAKMMHINRILSSLSGSSTDDEIILAIDYIRSHFPSDAKVSAELAQILVESGTKEDRSDKFTADVASTGGPSSLSTLLGPLFLQAAGAIVPKVGVPGRPAGGIDCLAQIKGYKTSLNKKEVNDILSSTGYAHFLADGDFVPLDGRMFKLRQLHEAQNVPTLVVASLLAKKIAIGVRYIGLDVRVSNYGNFGGDWSSAQRNALFFHETANILSLKVMPVLTNNNFPYQPYIGRRDALVALDDIFSEITSAWLSKHLYTCKNIALSCVPSSARETLSRVSAVQLRHFFDQNLIAQGGTPNEFRDIVKATRDQHFREVRAKREGFVYYPLSQIRNVLVHWQNNYQNEYNPFPDPVGLILRKCPGEWVGQGQVIATVRVEEEIIDTAMNEIGGLIENPLPYPKGLEIEGVWIDG